MCPRDDWWLLIALKMLGRNLSGRQELGLLLVTDLHVTGVWNVWFGPCQLRCLGSSVGRASVRSTECRVFEFHLRQLSFSFSHCLRCLSFFLSFFLSFYISDNIMYLISILFVFCLGHTRSLACQIFNNSL